MCLCSRSTSILMQSKSRFFPEEWVTNLELGHNIMDHHFKASAYAETDEFEDQYYVGSRPGGFYIPRFET